MESSTFSSATEPDLEQYRQVSVWAIVGLITGLLSATALAHPLLWAVPIAAAIISTVAIVSISFRDKEVSGRSMATLGLALALFFGGWSICQVMYRGYVIRGQARQFADHWMDLWQQGEQEKAHQLTLPAMEREPKTADLQAIYSNSEGFQQALDIYQGDTPRGWLRDLKAKNGSWRYFATEHHVQESPTEDIVTVLYDLSWQEEGKSVERRIRVVVQRQVFEMIDLVDWRIREVDHPTPVPL